MVRVKFTDNKGKSWIVRFPAPATLKDVKTIVKKIKPQIKKVERV